MRRDARMCGRGSRTNSACRACWRRPRARWKTSRLRHRGSMRASARNSCKHLGADRVRDDKYERAFHARGRSYHDHPASARRRSVDWRPMRCSIRAAPMKCWRCSPMPIERGIAVVPYGGGTSVVGGVSGACRARSRRSSSLDLSGMDRLLDVDAVSRHRDRGSGHLRTRARKSVAGARASRSAIIRRVFEFSTLGGWIAHRGAGQQSGRYGRAEDWLVVGEDRHAARTSFDGRFSGIVPRALASPISSWVRKARSASSPKPTFRVHPVPQGQRLSAAFCSAISQAARPPSAQAAQERIAVRDAAAIRCGRNAFLSRVRRGRKTRRHSRANRRGLSAMRAVSARKPAR